MTVEDVMSVLIGNMIHTKRAVVGGRMLNFDELDEIVRTAAEQVRGLVPLYLAYKSGMK